MLNPDVEAAAAVQRAVDYGVVGNIADLGGGFCITEFRVSAESKLVGVKLRDVAATSMLDLE